MKRTFKAANGELIVVDDTITLLGPNPDLSGCTPRERVAPGVRSFNYPDGKPRPDPRTMGPLAPEQSGYGNDVDSEEWRKKFWPGNEAV
jgi:hypothetical protein